MESTNANPAAGDDGDRQESCSAKNKPAVNSHSSNLGQRTIVAQLAGGTCRAAGFTATSTAPVLDLCRLLVTAGHDPTLPLHAYRGDVLALKARSIGEAARLEVDGKGTGFKARAAVGRAPPMRSRASGRANHRGA